MKKSRRRPAPRRPPQDPAGARRPCRHRLGIHGIALALALGLMQTGAGPGAAQGGDPISGQGQIVDGDSLVVGGIEVHLYGIDAPEIQQRCGRPPWPSWPCGQNAADMLGQRIANHLVRCRPIATDMYGRVAAECRAGGRDLAEVLLREGLATVTDPSIRRYVRDEEIARMQFRGIWSGPFAPPDPVRGVDR